MTDSLAQAVLSRGAQPGARLGVGVLKVKANSNGVAVVEHGTQQVEAMALTAATGTAVAVGDSVLLLREGSGLYMVGRLGVAPPPPPPSAPPPESTPPPTPPKPTYATKTVTFRPRFAGSYRRGSWRTDTSDVATGDWTGSWGINYGRAYYGGGPSGLKKVTKVNWAKVRIRRRQGGVFGGQTLPMVLMTEKNRPGGSGSVKRTANGPSLAVDSQVTWTLPQAWADDLVSGSAGGLGIGTGSFSPYIRTHSPSTWSSGWVLSINYTYRTS